MWIRATNSPTFSGDQGHYLPSVFMTRARWTSLRLPIFEHFFFIISNLVRCMQIQNPRTSKDYAKKKSVAAQTSVSHERHLEVAAHSHSQLEPGGDIPGWNKARTLPPFLMMTPNSNIRRQCSRRQYLPNVLYVSKIKQNSEVATIPPRRPAILHSGVVQMVDFNDCVPGYLQLYYG